DFVPRDIGDDDEESGDDGRDGGAVLLPDPESHSRLIMAAVFGVTTED
ncbi:MAG: hypothetical protein QG660_1968, partial [Pseudomonadota bacterium]|nr:hypothetical protein [Pseudomonadota bacterium]